MIDMQIIKTVSITAVVCAAMMIYGQDAFATSDVLKIHVWLDGVDSQTGPLMVRVTGSGASDTVTKKVDPFKEGQAGIVDIGYFTLDADSTEVGEHYEVCVYSDRDNNVYTCTNGVNTEKKGPEEITIFTPTGIAKPLDDTVYHPEATYYDDDGNVIKQGDDSVNTETIKDQGSGIGVSFGDYSDHNTVNIDQRSTFADVIRDLVPIAREGAHMAKDTAAQLLN